MSANRTLLIDAAYLLKRSMSGAKDVHTDKFGHIGGLYQFLTKIRQLIKKHKSNKVILFWDSETGGIFRHRLDNNYKSNRPNKVWSKIVLTDAEIRREKLKHESTLKQKKRIQSYAEELYFRQIEVDDIEADDMISYYIQKYHLKEDIVLYTMDRDFVQLLKYDIGIQFDNIDEVVRKYNFHAYFEYHYSNSLPMKIICGDTADGIVGVGGVGLETLSEHFPDFKFKPYSVNEIRKYAILHNEERVKNKKKPLKSLTNISNNVDRLKLNFELVNLEKPMLTDQAIEELEQLDLPLSPDGRSSSTLYNYMVQDDYLSIYGNTFPNYVEPFYTVIMNEKDIYNRFLLENKL